MKRILFVHHVSIIGGASYCLLNIIKELKRDRFQPIVLLRNEGPLVEELKKLGVEIHFYKKMWFYPYNHSLYNLRNLLTIFNLYRSLSDFDAVVRNCRPDIVYFNNMFLFPYLRVTQSLGIKSVIHVREHWPENQHQRQFKYIKKELLLRADKIIAINEYSAKMISPDMGNITIVYDWIDFSERNELRPFNKIFDEDMSDKKVYLYTGGQQRIKGALDVIRTFSEVVKGDDSRLLILGKLDEVSIKGCKGRIKSILYKMGLSTYEYKVRDAINIDSRIVCIPSTYYVRHIFEQSYCMLSFFTIPHANLAMAEAICLQLPCIAAETEESLEYSLDGELANLFPMNNTDAFAANIHELDKNYIQIKNRLAKSSEVVIEKFSKERNAELLRSVLDKL